MTKLRNEAVEKRQDRPEQSTDHDNNGTKRSAKKH